MSGIFSASKLECLRCGGRLLYPFPLGMDGGDLVRENPLLPADTESSDLINEELSDSSPAYYSKINFKGGDIWWCVCGGFLPALS